MQYMKIAILIPSLENVASVAYPLSLAAHFRTQGHKCDVFYFKSKKGRLVFSKSNGISQEFWGEFDWAKYDVVNSHGLIPDLFVFLRKPPFSKIKTVSTLHAFFFEELKGRYNYFVAWLVSACWCKILMRHEAYVCLTRHGYNHFLKLLNPPKLNYIHSGIEHFEQKSILPDDTREFENIRKSRRTILGIVSRLVAFKGIEQAVEVLTKDNDFHLVIVGDGPEKQSLIAKAIRLNVLDRISFLGFRAEGRQYAKHFDVFLMPSHSEPFGLTLLEAAVSKVPIVCSNIGTFRELFKDDEVSFFEPGKIDDLASAIKKALKNESQIANALSAFENKYSADKMCARYLHLFERLLWRTLHRDSAKQDIAVVVDEYPYPPFHGGSLANAERIDILSEQYNVHLFSLDKWNEQPVPIDNSLSQKNRFTLQAFFPYRKPSSYVILILDLLSWLQGFPYFSHGSKLPQKRKLHTYLEMNQIKKVLLLNSFVLPLHYFQSLDQRILFIDDNATFKIRTYRGNNPVIRFVFEFHAYIKKSYERRILNRASKAACLTLRDQRELQSLGLNKNLEISVLPVRPKSFKYTPQESRVLIAINMDYEPNQKSLIWFKQKVLPLLKDKAVIHLCGKDNKSFGKNLFASHPTVKYLGYLSREALEREYAQARLVVNPVIEGSGIQLKMIEALSYGLPIVSTLYSSQGLYGIPSSDNPEIFAQLIIEELRRKEPTLHSIQNYEAQKEVILKFVES